MTFPWHLYLMATIYILAGLNHFRNPKMYVRIIPPFFANPKLINILSGVSEVLLGILLCFPTTSHFAAIGIVVLLIAIFPANVFMYVNEMAGFGLPKWLLLLRLPLQILLILWALIYI